MPAELRTISLSEARAALKDAGRLPYLTQVSKSDRIALEKEGLLRCRAGKKQHPMLSRRTPGITQA